MKKKIQKIALHRETLVRLDALDLKQVEGGRPSQAANTCTTCNDLCTTNLC